MNGAVSAVTSSAHVATPNARRYLRMLCKHFRHKAPTTYDETHGRIEFADGTCGLDAGTTDGVLELRIAAADRVAASHLEDVVARHLQRFAPGEPLDIQWTRAD